MRCVSRSAVSALLDIVPVAQDALAFFMYCREILFALVHGPGRWAVFSPFKMCNS